VSNPLTDVRKGWEYLWSDSESADAKDIEANANASRLRKFPNTKCKREGYLNNFVFEILPGSELEYVGVNNNHQISNTT
jgi:hypothetical protein